MSRRGLQSCGLGQIQPCKHDVGCLILFVTSCGLPQDPDDESKTLTYANSPFHRIIPGFMIQGGDITAGNGTGGYIPLRV